MKKEAWTLRNAFWILTVICGTFAFLADFRGREFYAVLFLGLALISVIFGVYYFTLPNFQSFESAHEKASRHQSRRRTMKVIKGGRPNGLS